MKHPNNYKYALNLANVVTGCKHRVVRSASVSDPVLLEGCTTTEKGTGAMVQTLTTKVTPVDAFP